jgi:hypothetical protein
MTVAVAAAAAYVALLVTASALVAAFLETRAVIAATIPQKISPLFLKTVLLYRQVKQSLR